MGSKKSFFLALIFAFGQIAIAAETIHFPGVYPEAQNATDRLYLELASGKKVPALATYSSDGNGELIPLASRAQFASLLGLVSTETTLAALNAKVTQVDTANITVISSALPSGAATAANQSTENASLSSIDSKIIAASAYWTSIHAPAANTIATTTKATGGVGVRHVCTGITASLVNQQALAATDSKVYLRDGASGVGSILWVGHMSAPAGAGQADQIHISGLKIIGTANTAMTLEFASAPGTSSFETVTLQGYSI